MPKPRRGGGNNGGLSWIKKAEPKFIRDFKERIAYKEQSNVETKVLFNFKLWSNSKIFQYFDILFYTKKKKKKVEDDLVIEKDEDRPQVVQLRSGDLGEKEYLELKSKEDIQSEFFMT